MGVLPDNDFITGSTNVEHLNNLDQVLKRLSDADLRLKKKKRQFMKPSIECLGHQVDKDRYHPVEAKVKPIKEASAPTNVTELK